MFSSNKKPNFFVVGAAKAGTTALYSILSQHPDIYLTPIKETHFFSKDDMDTGNFRPDYIASNMKWDIDNYVRGSMKQIIHSAHVFKEENYVRLYNNVKQELAIGEICNSYLPSPSAPFSIRRTIPDAKILIILRNPVDRAYSGYNMYIRDGKTREKDFVKAVRNDFNKEKKGWGVSFGYVEMGLYYRQVLNYIDVFGKESLHIYLYDDFKNNTAAFVKQLYLDLGVDETFSPYTDAKNVAKKPKYEKLNYWLGQSVYIRATLRKYMPAFLKEIAGNVMYSDKKIPPLTHDQRKELLPYFEKDILLLQDILQRDLSAWLSV